MSHNPSDPTTHACQGHAHMAILVVYYTGRSGGFIYVTDTLDEGLTLTEALLQQPDIAAVTGSEYTLELN